MNSVRIGGRVSREEEGRGGMKQDWTIRIWRKKQNIHRRRNDGCTKSWMEVKWHADENCAWNHATTAPQSPFILFIPEHAHFLFFFKNGASTLVSNHFPKHCCWRRERQWNYARPSPFCIHWETIELSIQFKLLNSLQIAPRDTKRRRRCWTSFNLFLGPLEESYGRKQRRQRQLKRREDKSKTRSRPASFSWEICEVERLWENNREQRAFVCRESVVSKGSERGVHLSLKDDDNNDPHGASEARERGGDEGGSEEEWTVPLVQSHTYILSPWIVVVSW